MILICWVGFRVASYFPVKARADAVGRVAVKNSASAPSAAALHPVGDELPVLVQFNDPAAALSLSKGCPSLHQHPSQQNRTALRQAQDDGADGCTETKRQSPGEAKIDRPRRAASSVLITPAGIEEHRPVIPAPLRPDFNTPSPPLRLSPTVSAWMIWRQSGRNQLATAGQLGGSQAGVRATVPILALTQRTRLGATARLSAPLESRNGREAALGLSLRRSGTVPAEIVLERRIALGRGPDRFAVIGATGISDFKLGSKIVANGYAQAGVVGFGKRQAFVDGSMVVERHLTAKASAGIGIWGAAQPGVARLDTGPQMTVKVAAGRTPVRIAASWRFRLAGHAAPRSGPAITMGADF